MLLTTTSFGTSTALASAGVAAACMGVKLGKQVASPLSVGLLMVKKSKKRNPT
ncbi:adenine/guanine phosphoribosyltransferase-like PRPP-binding protein [Hymenobacter luteus]|uniref:Adenine/guanine phosphoribosyltransferase-like PRPP-binding protein n=2 Tax=Hymenobacter TaxID=89966 RepID=A0A7W9T0X4_9BACT|nr:MULTISPECIES: hypothetical protein [Hymenobacter]MBB4601125.1 adenine/guanine phosphoribosyltransferase-like PRPP-binding protein [Hymenobacter latericoloratus]MBB6058668.1 adenine/guanine phosphoribosyltransferase-like PRPP-binding protein [Hymenobacter luteus]